MPEFFDAPSGWLGLSLCCEPRPWFSSGLVSLRTWVEDYFLHSTLLNIKFKMKFSAQLSKLKASFLLEYWCFNVRVHLFNLLSTNDTFEFSLNYTNLATLAIKAYVGKSKINSVKKRLPPVGTSCDPLWCLPDWGNLALLVRLRF